MQQALEQVKTKYIVRTRGDEFYSHLEPLINVFKADDSKFVCGNIFARNWHDIPYHIGDHLFICRTSIALAMYDNLRSMYDGLIPLQQWAVVGDNYSLLPGGTSRISAPEMVLARSFLATQSIPITSWNDKNLFKKYFNIVDINTMTPFIARWQGENKIYANNFENPYAIKDMIDALSFRLFSMHRLQKIISQVFQAL